MFLPILSLDYVVKCKDFFFLFSGKIITSLTCYFSIEKSLFKMILTYKIFFLTDFQNFCCTCYDKFGNKY